MRILAAVILALLPTVCSAYIPPAGDLLEGMSSHFQRARTVQVTVVLENPDGQLLQKNLVSVPMRPGEEPVGRNEALLAGYLPFTFLTGGSNDLKSILPSLFSGDTDVSFTRLDGTVCYLLEGSKARLWIRKKDLFPLRADVLTEAGSWITSLYLDPVTLTRGMTYPSRTEVRNEGNLEYMERLSQTGQDAPFP